MHRVSHLYQGMNYAIAKKLSLIPFNEYISEPVVSEIVGTDLIVSCSPVTKALHIQFNRPKFRNALSLSQVQYLAHLFSKLHQVDSSICSSVLLTGKELDHFCAGGDIKAIILSSDMKQYCEDFFGNEYCADIWTAHLLKPFSSIWTGLTLGGGVGISIQGHYRIATDTTIFAMPESSIGFFPDVGASRFLTNLPNGLGLFLGLTGFRLNAADLIELKLATHFIPLTRIPSFIKELINPSNLFVLQDSSELFSKINNTLELFTTPPFMEPFLTEKIRDTITMYFSSPTSLIDLLTQLKKGISMSDPFVGTLVDLLLSKSPLSCALWYQQYTNPPDPKSSLYSVFNNEFKLCQSVLLYDHYHNFTNGVRALLIDKTDQPQWYPTSIMSLTQEYLDLFIKRQHCKELKDIPGLPLPCTSFD